MGRRELGQAASLEETQKRQRAASLWVKCLLSP